MKIHQLSIFLENKPGQLTEPLRLVADNGIDIRTLSLADTQQFGILRLVVSDWERARKLLDEAGFVVKDTEVVAIEVPDKPGGLADVLDVFRESNVNIEYMYAFAFGRSDRAVLIFRFDEPDEAIRMLQKAGINVIESIEIYNPYVR